MDGLGPWPGPSASTPRGAGPGDLCGHSAPVACCTPSAGALGEEATLCFCAFPTSGHFEFLLVRPEVDGYPRGLLWGSGGRRCTPGAGAQQVQTLTAPAHGARGPEAAAKPCGRVCRGPTGRLSSSPRSAPLTAPQAWGRGPWAGFHPSAERLRGPRPSSGALHCPHHGSSALLLPVTCLCRSLSRVSRSFRPLSPAQHPPLCPRTPWLIQDTGAGACGGRGDVG